MLVIDHEIATEKVMGTLTSSTQATPEDLAGTQSQSTIITNSPTSSVNGTSLCRRTIELELAVGNNGTNTTEVVS